MVQEKLASLGRLTAGIAHEIQNPLNFINNFSEVALELIEELDAIDGDAARREATLRDLQRSVRKVHEHGKRAQGIVGSMMMHARSSSDKRHWTDLNAILSQAVTLAEHSMKATRMGCQAAFRSTLQPGLPAMRVDPQEINRVVLNLLENAMDALCERAQSSPPGAFEPEVHVTSVQNNGSVEIRIRDNGSGIPETVRAKIFDPFFTTKSPGKGTGLGLSISYDIIHQHYGGTLSFESEEGVATEFIIRLPVRG